jgi:predicted transcriptional regulator of viral defense system
MKNIKVTKLEKQVLEALASGMYAELGYSDMGIADVASDTGLDRKILRGVAGSLEKKGLISIDNREYEGYKNQINMHIWYLTSETQGLVEHWVGQEDWFNKTTVEKVILEESK